MVGLCDAQWHLMTCSVWDVSASGVCMAVAVYGASLAACVGLPHCSVLMTSEQEERAFWEWSAARLAHGCHGVTAFVIAAAVCVESAST